MKKKIIIMLGIFSLAHSAFVSAMKTPIKKQKKVQMPNAVFVPIYMVQKPYKIATYYGGKRVVKKGTNKKVWGELIDLTEMDPITHSSFLEMIKEKHKNGMPYILAVLTVEEGAAHYARRYQDAANLVAWMFDTNNFSRIENKSKNVLTQQPILKPIHFFAWYPHEQGFVYIGSEADLKKDINLQSLLRVNAGKGFDIDLLVLGDMFFKEKKFDRAISILKSLEKKNNIAALLLLGDIYYAQNNYLLAEKYWKQAAHRNNITAMLNLMQLFLGGKASQLISLDSIGTYYKEISLRVIESQHDEDKWESIQKVLKQKYPNEVEQWEKSKHELPF